MDDPTIIVTKCPCGCGALVKPRRKYASSGCVNRGRHRSPEVRAKLSTACSLAWNDPEVRRKRSCPKGPRSEALKNKLRVANLGKHLSTETRARMSASAKGHPVSLKSRMATSEYSRQRKWTPEMRAKIRNANLGRKQSPEARAKVSVASKRSWQNPVTRTKRITAMVKSFAGRDKPSGLHLRVKHALSVAGILSATHVQVGHYVVDEADLDRKIAVEINGCYWHGCSICQIAGSKPGRNDNAKRSYLSNHGWTLIEIWEHDWKSNPAMCVEKVKQTTDQQFQQFK